MGTSLTRRELLTGLGATLLPAGRGTPLRAQAPGGLWVNDIHSRLNRTHVAAIERPSSLEAVADVVRRATREQRSISVMGGRHAMGGQQFGTDTVLVDTGGLTGILELDTTTGQVEVGAGTQWPALIDGLLASQAGASRVWSIVQKQTGADRLSLGGALAANIHSRGLRYRPIVQDVESFTLVDAHGNIRRCSRDENAELFRLAIGGYGLFGIIGTVRLRLAPRQRIERIAEVVDVNGVADRFAQRIDEGYLFGDFQYSTDASTGTLLRSGVFACYRPTDSTSSSAPTQELGDSDWLDLITLAHVDRRRAFEEYAGYYVGTSGQTYWSDTHQLSTYIDDYHTLLGARIGPQSAGTEMISELYVPRDALGSFLDDVRRDFVEHDVDLIYGTVRLIEADTESFLAWARKPWACVIFNLHTAHDRLALAKTAGDFRRLIDRARRYGGSYFLTYHRWARRDQVLWCHPRLPDFLRLKLKYDPDERFQSTWYRHYRTMLSV